MPDESQEGSSLALTAVCWPVFDFLIDFSRRVKLGRPLSPENVHYEAKAALRDAEDLARDNPTVERAWMDRVKRMMVYMIDYKMTQADWEGKQYWFDHRFELDPDVLNEVEALGGNRFFDDCEEVQREYEQAEKRDRRDKYILAETLSLYFVCLRLGFEGQYHGQVQELADYTRRLWMRLPAYTTTRGKDMFPETYRHNQQAKVDYRLGMKLSVVAAIFLIVLLGSAMAFRMVWGQKVGELQNYAKQWQDRAALGGTERS